MRRYIMLLMFAVATTLAVGLLSACTDYKTVKTSERIHESSPEPVAPGEMIVE